MRDMTPAEQGASGSAPALSGDAEGRAGRRGRTAPLTRDETEELFQGGVSLFNGARYWHAHESWETLWRAAGDDERDFFQGLIMVAAGFLHLQRRNMRGARNKLAEGAAKLAVYEPAHRGIFVNDLVARARHLVEEMDQGYLPYLIPPVIRFTDAGEADFSR